MTINIADNTPRVSYTVSAGATQTSFTVSFEFFAEADLNVYVDGTKKSISTHYTVSGGNGSTGAVAISVTGISGGSTVVITRSIALERTTDFPSQGAFQITTLNTELDRITAIQADLDDETQRSLRLADDDASVAMTLPLKATRVGTVLGFNASTGAPEAGPTIANVNSLSAITANINTVGGIAANVTTVAGKASEITSVAAKASLLTSDFVSDLNTLAVTDVINDINTLATSDIVTDLNLLATTSLVSNLNTLATSANVTAINNVSGDIANVNTVASNLSSVNSFSDRYRVSTNAPTTSLDAGDLWFDTTNNIMKVYGDSGFVNAGSSVNGTANRFAWTVGTSSGSYNGSLTVFPATYDAGFVDVFLNGAKLLVGSDVTATNGTSVTLATAAVAADIVEIVAYGTFTAATELSLLDNKKISLGTSQDLEFTWDGTDGHITVAGTLNIDGSGETLAKFIDNGAVELYHNNVKQIETTATGVLITGGTSNLLFKREDTTTIAGNPLGAIEFSHTDTDDAGTAAKILGEGDGSSGEGRIAFYTGTPSALTESMLIDSAGKVSISNDININSGTSKILFTRPDTTVIAGNPLGTIEFAHTDSDDAGTAAKIIGEGNGTAGEGRIAFYAGTPSALTEKLRIDSDGIKFNGDTSVDNALSDYEEGTWTPVGNAASGSNPTFTVSNAHYTRIGRNVHVTAILANVNTTGTTANQIFRIGGLPYTPDTGDTFGSVVTSLVDMDNVNSSVVMADASENVLTFFNQRHNQGASTPQLGRTNIDHQHIIDDESDFYFSITYYTSQ